MTTTHNIFQFILEVQILVIRVLKRNVAVMLVYAFLTYGMMKFSVKDLTWIRTFIC